MRAFFCFFLVLSWALLAQDFEKFQADYDTIKSDLEDAKERRVKVTRELLNDYEQRVYKLSDHAILLLNTNQSAAVKQAITNINPKYFYDDLRFLHTRLLAEHAASHWEMVDLEEKLSGAKKVNDQLEENGLLFGFQLQQIPRSLLTLEVIDLVLQNKEFSSGLCKGDDTCLGKLTEAQKEVVRQIPISKKWVEKARSWKQTPDVQPPLPAPQSKKPG